MKKVLAFILSAIMLVGVIPAAVFADGTDIPFTDVENGAWYADAAAFCYRNGLMSGTAADKFSPSMDFSRAMFVTVLAKIDGADVSEYNDISFSDVPSGEWYTKNVEWAYQNGYASGTGDGHFAPNAAVTREQIATFFYTYAMRSDYYVNTETPEPAGYTDVRQISSWAKTEMYWAINVGLISGTSATTVSPQKTATRAEVALIVKNFCNMLENNIIDRDPCLIQMVTNGTGAIFYGAKYIDRIEYAAGLYYNADEFNSVAQDVRVADDIEVDEHEMFKLDGNFIGTYTFFVHLKNGERGILLSARFEDTTAENPIGKLTLNGTDISEFSIIYGKTGFRYNSRYGVENNAKEIADELAGYIEKTTGAALTVAADSDVTPSEGAHEILIGQTNRENADLVTVDREGIEGDACFYEMKDNYLVIASDENNAGTWFASYRFITNVLGVDFYGNGIETICGADEVEVANGDRFDDEPYMEFACNYQRDGWNNQISANETALSFCNVVHTFPELARDDYDMSWGQHLEGYLAPDPCLSDPHVIDNMIKNVRMLCENRCKGNTNSKLIWFCQSDGVDYCKCDRCRRIYLLWGRLATYTQIFQYVGNAIKDDYPDVRLVGLAYKQTIVPASKVVSDEAYADFVNNWTSPYVPAQSLVAPDNCIMCVATDNSCSSHPIDDPDCVNNARSNVSFDQYFKTWASYFKTIYIWDYYTHDGHKQSPYPIIWEIYDNYQYFYKNNVKGDYGLGSTDVYGDFGELKTFIVGKMNWKPNISREEYGVLINNFLEAAYGGGWRYIRRYIDLREELSNVNEFDCVKCGWNYCLTEQQWRDNISDFDRLFFEALFIAEAVEENEQHALLLRENYAQIMYIKLRLAYNDYKASGSADDLADFVAINKHYKDTLELTGIEIPGNWTEDGDPAEWKYE